MEKAFERHFHAAANKLKAKHGVEKYRLSESALHQLVGTTALQYHAALMPAHVAVPDAGEGGFLCMPQRHEHIAMMLEDAGLPSLTDVLAQEHCYTSKVFAGLGWCS